MKRLLCLLTAVLLALSAALPAAVAEDSPVAAMLGLLSDLLDAREAYYELMSGAYDDLAAFLERNDYATLLQARITCNEVHRALPGMAAPEVTLTDEAFDALLLQGVDTEMLELMAEETRMYLQHGVNNMSMYESLLFTAAYQLSQAETLSGWLALDRREIALYAAYDGYTINHMLLSVADDPAAQALWQTVPSRWPLIGESLHDWESDDETLTANAMALLDGYEANLDDSAAVLGQDSYAFDRLTANYRNADLNALREDANPIAGMPAMLPLPAGWLLLEDCALYASYDEGEAMPTILTYYATDVALEAYNAYIDELAASGAALYRREGSDAEGWQTVIVLSDEPCLLYWNPDETVFVSYDPRALSLETSLYILSAP